MASIIFIKRSKYLKDFSSHELPLRCIIWILEQHIHLLKVQVSNPFFLTIISHNNLISDISLCFLVNNIEKDVSIKLVMLIIHDFLAWYHFTQSHLKILYSIRWMKQIKLLFAFLGWFGDNPAVLVDVVLQAFSDLRLAWEFNSSE